MKNNSTLRILVIAVCAGTIANSLILVPLMFEYYSVGEQFKNFFGVTLLQNLEADKRIIPAAVEALIHLAMVAGLILALATKAAPTRPEPYGNWGVAASQPPAFQDQAPPPPPPPAF